MTRTRKGTARGDLVAYFGYGSLVNRATLDTDYVAAVPARLSGWRRHWQPRNGAIGLASPTRASLLTVHRSPRCVIDGLLIIDRAANLPAVDRREAQYARIALTVAELEINGVADVRPHDLPLYVYAAPDRRGEAETPPVLASYLDVVMAGFLREFGAAGMTRFIASTDGFERGVRDDRRRPVYSRSVRLSAKTTATIDRHLQTGKITTFAAS